ncbi:agarase [Thalassotalea agarivorans]|uniref:Agarase n=1 Tax=Thalassotalea agarivorans TaxID=349064 RepID=A0A1I0AVH7_THASX|nr:agarase [Thalassotalea agarivorans]SES97569.1 agarase [Thalassotalea agarivorans]
MKHISAAKASGIIFSLVTTLFVSGCENGHQKRDAIAQNSNVIFDFESEHSLASVQLEHAAKSLMTNQDGKGLSIQFDSKAHHQSSVSFQADSAWNWTQYKDFGVALDISNPNKSSAFVYISVTDIHGASHNRSAVIPAQSQDTYLIELAGKDLQVESGIRSNPPSWPNKYQSIIWRYGNKNIDLANVAAITFKVIGVNEDKTLVFDNITLVEAENIDTNYLTGLVDKYGQNAKRDFENKISSDQELLAISQKEQALLTNKNFADRGKYNGWKDGPKLNATGFYRVEKYQGKWSLVDPEGYLFFSNGLANVRMANTSTITGFDFDQNYIVQREPGDLTPEDSIGLNRAPKKAWPTRYKSSPLRADMFNWLPNYEDPMGQHYGYRREVHSGAVERGETYSFYQANLARKYQTDDVDLAQQKWRETTVKRMQSWGFTSFGNWIDPSYYQMENYPYFANGWIIGDFKTVSSGNDYWAPLPDPFDSEFEQRARVTVKQIAKEVNNSPWCIGVFIDNEKSWGQMGSIRSQYAIPLNALTLDANSSPTKAHFTALLKQKYVDISKLNKAWDSQIADWDALDKGISIEQINEAMVSDLSTMLYEFGLQYFQVVDRAMQTYMPNHLYMGVRFADWGMTPELRQAAAEVADVVSYNYYKEVINDDFWQFLEALDKPSIIGEFHNGAVDSGLLNPGLVHASDQQDRGKKYAEYVNSAIDNPYLVGTHWFQYIDSPLTGRALDGENYNVGFVSVTDIPYQPLVDAAKDVNKNIYSRRYTNE